MDILISNSSDKPIYEQITSQIKNKIIRGELPQGTALPSMRLLAKDLRISVITTKRAYSDLERDGFIETVPGKGELCGGPQPGSGAGTAAPPGGGIPSAGGGHSQKQRDYL